MRDNPLVLLALTTLAILALPAHAQVEIDRAVIATGGGAMSSATLAVRATAGQATIGSMSNAQYNTSGGYWYQEEEIAEAVGPAGDRLPEEFSIAAAPNPARELMVLRFAVPRKADVSIELYDVSGRRVLTLAEGPRGPGYHQATLGADRLPSGVYFARMEAPGFRAVRRLVLLR